MWKGSVVIRLDIVFNSLAMAVLPRLTGGLQLISLSQFVEFSGMESELTIQQMAQYRIKELKVKLKKQEYKFMALHDLLDRVISENTELKRRLK